MNKTPGIGLLYFYVVAVIQLIFYTSFQVLENVLNPVVSHVQSPGRDQDHVPAVVSALLRNLRQKSTTPLYRSQGE